MAKTLAELKAKLPPHVVAEAERRAQVALDEMALKRLRVARKVTQGNLAIALRTNQGAVSKLERRTDMHLSSLRSYVHALGGELDIVVRFPDKEYHITRADDLRQIQG